MDFDHLFIYLYCLFGVVRLTTAEDCKKIDECSCKTPRGNVDLHKLAQTINPRFHITNGGYTYQFEPCNSLSSTCSDKTSGVAVCQKSESNSYVAGFQNSAKFSGLPYGKKDLNLTYTAEEGGTLRTSVFRIVCKEGVDGNLVSVVENPTNTYLFELQTKYACLNSGGNSDDNNTKISAGSVLLIIFFVFLALYFVVGILFLKFRGATGTEMIPNYEFWSSLPGYIKDGFVFSCRGCKKESSYSQI